MEQSNPWGGLLNKLLDTAGSVVPGVIGKKDNTSTQLRNVSGTAEPAAKAASAGMPKWVLYVIGGVGLIGLIIVLGIFARRA